MPCCKKPTAIAATIHRQAMHMLLFMLLFLAAFLLGARIACAEPAGKGNAINDDGTLMVLVENDKFGGGTDQHYSNGLMLTWVSPDVESLDVDTLPGWIADYDDITPKLRGGDRTHAVSFSLGHAIYTPIDVKTEELVEDDRPYAGWLFLSMGLHAKNEDVLDIFETTIGMVGPAALGEEVQNNFHNFIGTYRSEGWDNQLHNEPGLMLSWQRNWRLRPDQADMADEGDGAQERERGFGWDVIPNVGVTIGNVMTHATAGGEVRFGWNLPDNFGSSLIGPARGVSAPSADPDDHGLGAHVFAGSNARIVGRNIFLDGNSWQDSPSVAKKWLVGELFAGGSVHWDGYALTYTQVARSAEYYGQEEQHVFGSLMFSVAF